MHYKKATFNDDKITSCFTLWICFVSQSLKVMKRKRKCNVVLFTIWYNAVMTFTPFEKYVLIACLYIVIYANVK